jgi:exodeoxyribonuclease-5
MYDWADQIICATNNLRNSINFEIRNIKGFSTEPQVGDKIIALKNYWDTLSENTQLALTNGTIGTLNSLELGLRTPPYYITDKSYNILTSTITTDENDAFVDLEMDLQLFTTGEKTLTSKQEYLLKKNKEVTFGPPMEFTYAYAITCWKAQGSEWNKVLLFEEKFPFDLMEHRRYLYTGLTRAKEKIVIITKEN